MTDGPGTTLLDLDSARSPEDVFGSDPATAKAAYLRLARELHPDGGGDADAFKRLGELWREALRLMARGLYGSDVRLVTVRTRRAEYLVGRRFAAGRIADLHLADAGGVTSAFKAARRPRDNDLLRGEADAVRGLRRALGDRYAPFLPELVESVAVRQSGGRVRQANVLGLLDGFYSLSDVAVRYPDGIHPLDAAWMWRRLLFLLGAVHREGVVHGAINPDHVLIHPEKHGLVLLDWCYSAERGARVRALDSAWELMTAPEILSREPVGPETDLFMAAATLGGVTRHSRGFAAHLRSCTAHARSRRMSDAWELKEIFEEYLERNHGPRKFRPFTMHGKEN